MSDCHSPVNELPVEQKATWPLSSNKTGLHEYSANQEACLRVKDFSQKEGVSLTLADKSINPETTLIRGNFSNRELCPGLNLHFSDTQEEHAFTAAGVHPPGLSCIFFLSGNVDIEVGHQSFEFKNSPYGSVNAVGLFKKHQESFQRVTRNPQCVRHLVLTATPEWLAENGLDNLLGGQYGQQKMAFQRWAPTAQLSSSIQDFFTPSALAPALANLQQQARALNIVTESVSALSQTNQHLNSEPKLNQHDSIRLQRARDLIHSGLEEDLSVNYIARQAGICASGLQKLFRRIEGQSVIEYVRQIRMKQALTSLSSGSASVKEISAAAGYKNPANFATAFKRQFGITPSEVAK